MLDLYTVVVYELGNLIRGIITTDTFKSEKQLWGGDTEKFNNPRTLCSTDVMYAYIMRNILQAEKFLSEHLFMQRWH